jgi:hypothetical protein
MSAPVSSPRVKVRINRPAIARTPASSASASPSRCRFWNRNQGEIAEKKAAAERQRLEAEALGKQIASEADTARREMQANADLARETRDKLLPLVIEQTASSKKPTRAARPTCSPSSAPVSNACNSKPPRWMPCGTFTSPASATSRHRSHQAMKHIALILISALPLLAAEANRAQNTVILEAAAVANLQLDFAEAEETTFEETIFSLGHIEVLPGKKAIVSSRIPGRAFSVLVIPHQEVDADAEVAWIESRQPGDPPPVIKLNAPISRHDLQGEHRTRPARLARCRTHRNH